MTFDSDISEDVSLSKVLDSFLEDGEEPNIICTFLTQHETDFKDIINHSLSSTRIFQIDFIAKLSFKHQMFIYKMINCGNVDESVSNILVWQIFQSNIEEMTKNMFRHFLNMKITKRGRYSKHPYSTSEGKMIRALDMLFSDINNSIDYIVEKINSLDDNTFNNIIKYINGSLWCSRILQMDIFLSLTTQKQYILVKNLQKIIKSEYHELALEKFFMQSLSSDIDAEIKKGIFDVLNYNNFNFNYNFISSNREVKELTEETDSFAEMIMKLSVMGMDYYGPYVIFQLLMKRKMDMLFQWLEYDKESMETQFDICNLLELIKKENGR